MDLPKLLQSGAWREGHVQGIAVDAARGFIYYSFTTVLLKTDFKGAPVGCVGHLAGHLGCITFDAEKNRVYGSLELKHDAIGAGIIRRTGWDPSAEDGFYLVSFEGDRIDRMDLNAETDDVMRAVYLSNVVKDYRETDEASGAPHRYGCSGIDGTALGPAFGTRGKAEKIMVAYGVYGDTARADNDYQVILQYDRSIIDRFGKPLDQADPHHSGPAAFEARYFFYTGNTVYGVQNLEYDPAADLWLTAVYRGKKERFSNFPLFLIDNKKAPVTAPLAGRGGERGAVLSPADLGAWDKSGEAIRGCDFPLGQTGVAAMGDGRFYFSEPISDKAAGTFSSTVRLYRFDPQYPELFIPCS